MSTRPPEQTTEFQFELARFIEKVREAHPQMDLDYRRLTFTDRNTHAMWIGWLLAKGMI